MDVTSYYKNRIEEFSKLESHYFNKEKKIPFIRLAIIIFSILFFYIIFSFNIFIAIAFLVVAIVGFIIVVKYDDSLISKNKYYNNLKIINEKELKHIENNEYSYPNGSSYINNEHWYSSDLDLFGNFSLFQYINRTTLKFSSDILADWLLNKANNEEIKLRQESILELKNKIDWRQDLIIAGLKNNAENNDVQKILGWIKEPSVFINKKSFILVCKVLPVITIISITLSFVYIPVVIPILLVFLHLLIINNTKNNIKIIHAQVSKNVNLLKAYTDIISVIEKEKFQSQTLQLLCNNIKNASQSIKYLTKILNNLDFRFNILVHPIINTLFLFDFHNVVKLERWKQNNVHNTVKWFLSVGEFEVLSSFANLSFNNPDWVFPKISAHHFIIKAKNIGHPLLNQKQRVCNDFELTGNSKINLITGSNMSGKSTFLRTVGLNIVLASIGSCVCAKEFVLSPIQVLTSMRINDSLEENTSSFFAELKRIELIIKLTEQKEKVFLLLDEILRGTNSNDRHIGSIALIKQLIKNEAIGIVATHDIPLSELSLELPNNIENFNFDVKVNDNELFFDYKLNNGICKSLNASILMRKMGIKI